MTWGIASAPVCDKGVKSGFRTADHLIICSSLGNCSETSGFPEREKNPIHTPPHTHPPFGSQPETKHKSLDKETTPTPLFYVFAGLI